MNFSKTLRNAKHIELIYPYYRHNNRTGTAVLFDNRPPEFYDCTVDRLLDALAGYCFTDVHRAKALAREWTGQPDLRKPPIVLDGDITLMPVKMRDVRGSRSSLGYAVIQKLGGITKACEPATANGRNRDTCPDCAFPTQGIAISPALVEGPGTKNAVHHQSSGQWKRNPTGAMLMFRSGHNMLTRQNRRTLLSRWKLAARLTRKYKEELWIRKVKEDVEVDTDEKE